MAEKTPPTPPAKKSNDDEVTLTAEAPGEKVVRVRALTDHKCSMGGRKYNMRKHGEYDMPESDANILQQHNKVMKK